MQINRFEDLEVWQLSREQLKAFNLLTFSTELKFDGVMSYQMRRAATSVMANIAEGFERNGNKELLNFLYIAKASNGEFRSHLYAVVDLELITSEQFNELYNLSCRISGALFNFIQHLKKSELKGIRFKE